MSFKREVFEKVGLFNERLGFTRKVAPFMQGAEPELALRLKHRLGKGVIYNPQAVVYHKVPRSKTRGGTLVRRAFYQGLSKAALKRISPSHETLATEKSYLKDILFKYVPRRVRRICSGSHPVMELKQLSVLVVCVFSVGLGFVYGHIKRR